MEANFQHMQNRGSSKGLIFGIIGGAIALILIIVGIIVAIAALSGGGVSKADYQKVASLLDEATDAQNQIIKSRITVTEDKATGDKKLAAIKSNDEKFQKAYQALENATAVKNDKKLAEQFEAVKNKKPKLDEFVTTMTEFGDKVYPTAIQVSKKVYSTSQTKDIGAWKKYSTKLKSVQGDLKSEATKSYVSNLIRDLDKIASVAKQVSNNATGKGDYDGDAFDTYSNANLALQKDSSEYAKNTTTLQTNGQLTSQLDAMGNYLYLNHNV